MIMAKDGRVCKLHRLEWPGFIRRMLPPAVWRSVNEAERAAGGRAASRAGDSRTLWTLHFVLLAYVAMGWSVQLRLSDRFREARELVVQLYRNRRRPGTTYVGLTGAGVLLRAETFQRFWACVRQRAASLVGQAWTWSGWVVVAFDGSREGAPRTKANERELGVSGREKSGPQFWMTWAVHLPTLLLWDWRQGCGNSSERSHLLAMLKSLPRLALIVADAGFTGFDFLCSIIQADRHFLIRCGSNVSLLVEGAAQELVHENGQRIVYLWPTNRRRKAPLRLRLIELKHRGRKVYLLTNVVHEGESFQTLSRATAGVIYRARWGIEVNYRSFKRTMQRLDVLARTPDRGAVELAGNIVAMGLLRMHAAMVMGAKMARMSVAGVLRVIRQATEAVRCGLHMPDIAQRLAAAVRDEYERHSPKKARDWPHKKNEDPAGPPKMHRLTKNEIGRIHRALGQEACLEG